MKNPLHYNFDLSFIIIGKSLHIKYNDKIHKIKIRVGSQIYPILIKNSCPDIDGW